MIRSQRALESLPMRYVCSNGVYFFTILWIEKPGGQLVFLFNYKMLAGFRESIQPFKSAAADLPPIPTTSAIEFKSRDLVEKEIMNALKDDNVYSISFCGMAGVANPYFLVLSSNPKCSSAWLHLYWFWKHFSAFATKNSNRKFIWSKGSHFELSNQLQCWC